MDIEELREWAEQIERDHEAWLEMVERDIEESHKRLTLLAETPTQLLA